MRWTSCPEPRPPPFCRLTFNPTRREPANCQKLIQSKKNAFYFSVPWFVVCVKAVCCALGLALSISFGQTISPRSNSKVKSVGRAALAERKVRPALEVDLNAAGLHYGDPIFIRAFKDGSYLEVFVWNRKTEKFVWFRTYPILAQSGVLGPKLLEGDGQVPEGFYQVPPSAMNSNSRFHLSFNIGYPNPHDLALKRTGSAIMVHGNRVSIGCLAMGDPKIEEIYSLCAAAHRNGQEAIQIHLFPFKMTVTRLLEAKSEPDFPFWNDLKIGYDRFERDCIPPSWSVKKGRYHFD